MLPTTPFTVGNYRIIPNKYETGTLRHADVLSQERFQSLSADTLDSSDIYTPVADGVIFYLDGERPKLAITHESQNLLLADFPTALPELLRQGYYRPDQGQAQEAIAARNTVTLDLRAFKVNEYKSPASKFGPGGVSHAIKLDLGEGQLNGEEQKLVDQLLGSTEKGTLEKRVMEVMNQKIRSYWPNGEYDVKEIKNEIMIYVSDPRSVVKALAAGPVMMPLRLREEIEFGRTAPFEVHPGNYTFVTISFLPENMPENELYLTLDHLAKRGLCSFECINPNVVSEQASPYDPTNLPAIGEVGPKPEITIVSF